MVLKCEPDESDCGLTALDTVYSQNETTVSSCREISGHQPLTSRPDPAVRRAGCAVTRDFGLQAEPFQVFERTARKLCTFRCEVSAQFKYTRITMFE